MTCSCHSSALYACLFDCPRYGHFTTNVITGCMEALKTDGSRAAPGFMRPEGVIVYHPQSRQSFKWTIEKDGAGKGHGA